MWHAAIPAAALNESAFLCPRDVVKVQTAPDNISSVWPEQPLSLAILPRPPKPIFVDNRAHSLIVMSRDKERSRNF